LRRAGEGVYIMPLIFECFIKLQVDLVLAVLKLSIFISAFISANIRKYRNAEIL